MSAAMEAISWRTELAQMAHYLRNVASEIENAERLTFPDLHAAVGHIRDGLAPIPREAEVFIPVPVPARVVRAETAFDLDAEGPPIYASSPTFQVIDRGPAIPMRVATRSETP